MKIIISDIPDEGLIQEADQPLLINDNAKPDIAHVFIKAVRFGKRVLVEGLVKISATLKCSRCLTEFPRPFDLAFKEEYLPSEDISRDKDHELTGGEMDVSFYSNDELDISELLKEQVLLAAPMKPLCRDDCRGLCPACGEDLNKGACDCRKEEIDPRLASLEKFKELLKERKE
ncbi:MAG: DUF177 domain-containing protein [Nitrospirae bacterium]|nr:DUF177 domain-containing protein [Nitrospirota bacterium]